MKLCRPPALAFGEERKRRRAVTHLSRRRRRAIRSRLPCRAVRRPRPTQLQKRKGNWRQRREARPTTQRPDVPTPTRRLPPAAAAHLTRSPRRRPITIQTVAPATTAVRPARISASGRSPPPTRVAGPEEPRRVVLVTHSRVARRPREGTRFFFFLKAGHPLFDVTRRDALGSCAVGGRRGEAGPAGPAFDRPQTRRTPARPGRAPARGGAVAA